MVVEFALFVFLVWIGVLAGFGRDLYARWREPAFIKPIVIFESDDWGAGPVAQAESLQEISALLRQHVNATNEHPVMTLGVILAAPAKAESAANGSAGSAVTEGLPLVELTDQAQHAIVAAMREGVARQVFALQLHGLTHFNEAALLAASKANPQVAAWLAATDSCWTERLPSELQSAWIDGSRLPSADVPASIIQAVALREGKLWQALFGAPPRVAVPTTFIWTEAVEAAWAAIGIEVMVTPGARYPGRDAAGKPARHDRRLRNGETGPTGIRYVVRDIYFEPSLGHSIPKLIEDIGARSRAFRPALIEMHRFNFCGPRAHPEALEILQSALFRIMAVIPEVRFMSTQRLAEIMSAREPAWVATAPRVRLRALFNRLREIPGFRKIAGITGLFLPLWIFQRLIA